MKAFIMPYILAISCCIHTRTDKIVRYAQVRTRYQVLVPTYQYVVFLRYVPFSFPTGIFWLRRFFMTRNHSLCHICTRGSASYHSRPRPSFCVRQFPDSPVESLAMSSGSRHHEIPGRATAGQLQAAALSVRVTFQSSSTVTCCVRLVSHSRDPPNSATMLPSKGTRQRQTTNERTNPKFSTTNVGICFNGSRSLPSPFLAKVHPPHEVKTTYAVRFRAVSQGIKLKGQTIRQEQR